MNDFISRNALQKECLVLTICPGYEKQYINAMYDRIRNAPAVDAIEKLQSENEYLKSQLDNEYMNGVKYAIYEIMKEADIRGSQEIRDSGWTDDMMCAAVAEKIRAVIDLPAEDAEHVKRGEWINVEDRLPERTEDVLMLFETGVITGGFICDSDSWCGYGDGEYYTDCTINPTHWMPLPKPPKMDEGKDDE